MNNKVVTGVVVAIVIIGGLFYFSKKQYQPQQPVNQVPAVQQPTNPVETNAITIENFAFSPGTLTVQQGQKVTWTNKDSAPHKIKSDTFNSLELKQGDTFEFTFINKGSFGYVCSIHPSMAGTIVVE